MTLLTPNATVVDTAAPLEWFLQNGYYQVGSKIFAHKIYALQEASQSQQTIDWNFNKSIFDKFDWRKPLGINLLELYRIRAEQIRNKYRYIIAMWSGGGDSTTMVEAFCDNGIHLDEVVCVWPITQSQNLYTPNPLDRSGENMPSEWDFSIKPQIEKLKKKYPNLKITIIDQDLAEKEEYRDDTVRIVGKHSYLAIQKGRHIDRLIQQRQETYGHGVATIWGISPVDVIKTDNWLSMYFCDQVMGQCMTSDYTLSGVHRKIEYFYWSPEFPELIREQAHVLLNDLNVNPHHRAYIYHYKLQKDGSFLCQHSADYEITRQWKKSLIYPNYPRNQFQVAKQIDSHHFSTWETWFHRQSHAQEFLDPWQSAIQQHQKLIDSQYLVMHNSVVCRYKMFFSPFYTIGRIKDIN